MLDYISGGFRNSERGVQPLVREACRQIFGLPHLLSVALEVRTEYLEACRQIFGLPHPLSVALEVRTEYLEATLGLVKCLEISKELIRECVTCLVVVAACHSCIII